VARKIVYPLPEGELWGCLSCEMLAGRVVDADVLLLEGEPGKPGVVRTGLCASHAEILEVTLDDFREAQRRFQALGGQ